MDNPLKISEINYGKLKWKIKSSNNTIYYRKGLEELSLNITNICPNNCTFCIRDKDLGWGVSNLYLTEEPSIEKIKSDLDNEFKKSYELKNKIKKIKICGYGEPILRINELISLIEYIKRIKPSLEIQLTTTGWPYFRFISKNEKILEIAKKEGLNKIYLSLNSIENNQYKKIVRPGINHIDTKAFRDSIKFGVMAKNIGLEVILGFIKLNGITDKKVMEFSKRFNLNYRLRELE